MSSLSRLRRLAVKELKEILRDRRTLVTLVLMPFLLYPLFSLVLRKFMFAGALDGSVPTYNIGCETPVEASLLQWALETGKPIVERRNPDTKFPPIAFDVVPNPQEALQAGRIDLVLKVTRFPTDQRQPNSVWEMDCELVTLEGSLLGERAQRVVEDCFRAVGSALLTQRLRAMGVNQRATPVRATRRVVKSEEKSAAVSLSSLIPFVLILMTITGAVYPAIDLTAGERERGTLELLIAAPVPRLGLLLAKYVAVLAVAMLTATVNLIAMTTTVTLSGLGQFLWGEQGLSLGTILAVFGLLFMLAGFFSAVLLTITSFARSFKEAQAYLIPVMLCALGPGMISLMPGVRLQGWMLVTPLLNTALLSRDLLAGEGTLWSGAVVFFATALYAFAALAVAARLFAAEGVMFDARLGWSDVWKRPDASQTASVSEALLCLACIFPLSFAALGGIGQLAGAPLAVRLGLVTLATILIYGGVPAIFAWWRRLDFRQSLSWRRPSLAGVLGATVLGLSLWPLAHEIVVLSQYLGLATVGPELQEKARATIAQARSVPLWLFVSAIALAPAIFEEFCFRGYVFGALRNRLRPATAVLWSGVVFGAFHVVTSDMLAMERLLPTTLLGCVLGWVCWQTGSLFPGMFLHATHNGALALAIYFLPQLKQWGWGMEEREHLPVLWLAAAAVGVAIGSGLIWLGRSKVAPRSAT